MSGPAAGRLRCQVRDSIALSEAQVRACRRDVEIGFQDPYASLNPRMAVEELLLEPRALHNIVPVVGRHGRG